MTFTMSKDRCRDEEYFAVLHTKSGTVGSRIQLCCTVAVTVEGMGDQFHQLNG